MKTPRIIIFIVFISVFFVSFVIMSYLTVNIYDQNCILNIVEKKIYKQKYKIRNNYHVLNIESKIESKIFLDLMKYLENNRTESVFFDMNFSNLSDSGYNNDIRDFIKQNDNIYSYVKLNGSKSIRLSKNYLYETIAKDLTYLKTSSSFLYSSYTSPVKMDNTFSVENNKIGFITDNRSACDADNLDLLYKLDNKYLINLSLLNYINKKKINLADVIFSNSSALLQNIPLFYDQKGRMSYMHDIRKPDITAESFLYWKNSLTARKEAVDNLIKLDLIKNEGPVTFEDEEAAIDNIYNIDEYRDENKNALLTVAKNKASLWKSFKESTKKNVTNMRLIIVQNGDFGWVPGFIADSAVFEVGRNLKRFPVSLIIVGLALILFFLLLAGTYHRKMSVFTGIIVFIIILSNVIYFIIRLVLNYDFPFSVIFSACVYSLIAGFILRNVNYSVWNNEVRSIFRSNISAQTGRHIIELLRSQKWDLDSKQYICTFLSVDTKVFLQKEFQEEDIETISQKSTEIENLIKNNNGIIDTVNAGYISSYFGNPPISKDSVMDAIKVAELIGEIPLVLNNTNQRLKIAVHSRKEWFKYQEKYGEKFYSHYGNSYNIIESLLKVANEFEVDIVISDAVYKLAGMNLPVRMFDRIKVKGLKNSFRVFELLTKKQSEEMGELIEYFHAGLKLFEQKKWEEAGAYFRQCLKIKQNDVPSMIYLQRCKDFIYVPPLDNWDGSYEVD